MSNSTPHATPSRPAARHPAVALALAGLLGAALLGGCASGPQAQWSDASLGSGAAKPLQGARVLVVCEAAEAVMQQLCQDRMAEELTARGLTPVRPAQSANGTGRGAEAYLGAARAAGASGLLLTTVMPDTLESVARPSPFSIGIGGFGIGGGHVGAGVGVSVPIGGSGVASTPGYAVNSSFNDARDGRLLWSARTSSQGSDLNAGMAGMARTLMGAAEKAGVF